MSRRPSRTARLLIGEICALLGPAAQLVHAHEREWASITFTGARHRLVLEIAEEAMTWPSLLQSLERLPEHEFRLRGEIVADCSVTIGLPLSGGRADVRLVVIEILTVVAH